MVNRGIWPHACGSSTADWSGPTVRCLFSLRFHPEFTQRPPPSKRTILRAWAA